MEDQPVLPLSAPAGNSTVMPMMPPQTAAAPPSQDAQPADTLSDPNAGRATIGDTPSGQALASFRPSTPTPVSNQAAKIADGTNGAAAAAGAAASAPGGWARTLLAGALHALGTTGKIAGGIATMGIEPAIQAGQQQAKMRQQKEQFNQTQEADKNKALNGEANARMVYQQQLTHKLQEEGVDASLASGKEQLAAWKNQPNPGIERVKGVTADQAKQMLKDDKLDPTEETMVPSGIMTVTDKDGQPHKQLTYSVIRVTPVDLDPKDPDQKAILDRLNKYAPPEPGKKWQGEKDGTVHLEGSQYNMALQMANEQETAGIATRAAAARLGIAAEDVKKDEESLAFRQDPNIIKALGNAATVNGVPDFISARNALLQASQNPQSPLYGKYNNVDNDMREYLGYTEGAKGEKNYLYDKMLEDYQKRADQTISGITDLVKKTTEAHGDESSALAQTWQAKADATKDPGLKAQYLSYRDLANKQADASLKYAEDKKTKETAAEEKAQTGDMSGIKSMVENYDYDPDKLFSRFKDMKSKRDFLSQVYADTGQQWSDSEYKARYQTKQDYRPEGKGGQAVQSLNTFALHTGDANDVIQKLNNTKSPLFNRPINKWDEAVLGQPQVMQYRVAIAAAADNYINYLLNNKAKHASDDDLAAKLQSTDTSPQTAQTMLRQMANTIALKAREQNFAYRKQMGQDIPEFLDPDTAAVLKTFGIDPAQITTPGRSGLVNTPTQQPTGQQSKLPPTAKIAFKDANGNIIGYK